MAERNADDADSNDSGRAPGAAAANVTSTAAAPANTSGSAWRSQEIWEQSGFLAFLAAHEIKRRDLLGNGDDGSSSSETVEHRFFRYVLWISVRVYRARICMADCVRVDRLYWRAAV